MQESVGIHHRKFFRGSHDKTLHPARARRTRPTSRRVAGGPDRHRADVPGPDRCRGTGGATVNCPTTRCSTPDAAPRTGRGESAPRGTQGKTSVPFAAIPHDIAAGPRLTPTDLRVLAALLYFARQDASCWPCDHSIAARVHRHPGTVRRALRRLEDLGYIRRAPTWENPTGRLIHLTCKESDWPRPAPAPTPVRRRVGGSSVGARGGRAPARADRDVIVGRIQDQEPGKGETSERSRPEIPSTPAIPREQPVVVAALTAEVLPPTPPAPAPQPESEPAPLPDCRSES